MPRRIATGWLAVALAATARAETLTVTVPAGADVTAAVATTGKATKTDVAGKVAGRTVTFDGVRGGAVYDVRLTLKGGTVLQGVSTRWYALVADEPTPPPALTDDDRQQMTAVVTQVTSFFKDKRVVLIAGDGRRAVMLVEQQRGDSDDGPGANIGRGDDFHSSKGEVVWRPELWYFENHHGGWEKVPQTDRVLFRERFKSRADYHAAVDKLQWVTALGGVVVKATAGASVTLAEAKGLPATATRPTTRPG